ncbi:MAG: hypothetical protein ACYC5H_12185 [Methylovirgula sp.]
MRPQPITLRLGTQEWRVRPLTLKQIQEIEPLLLTADQSAGRSIATAIAIIAVALTRDHPEAAQRLDEIEASAQEVGAAMSAVLQLGGFVPNGHEVDAGQALGKAEAGADGISASSTPA